MASRQKSQVKLSTFLSSRQICGVNCLKVESIYDVIQPHTALHCTIGGGWQSASKQYSSNIVVVVGRGRGKRRR